MKTKKMIVVIAALLAIVFTTNGYAQPNGDKKENVKTFMRLKLKHAQEILEGLTVENYDQIAQNAQEISLLSQASQWQVLQTPEYVRRSTEFRRAVDDLTEAGKARNLDGATLSYVNVAMKCVECHKYVRSVRDAKLELPPEDDLGRLAIDNRRSEFDDVLVRWLKVAWKR